MKALTLWQPWASLIAEGYKDKETRSWKTNYRGKLAIHSAKTTKALYPFYPDYAPCGSVIAESAFPLGAILCTCNLLYCLPVEDVEPDEFGDYSAGRWAWVLGNVQKIEPIYVKGKQGLWNLDEATELAVMEALK